MSSTTSDKQFAPSRTPSTQSAELQQKKGSFSDATEQVQTVRGTDADDDAELARMGYKAEFAREFKSLSVSSRSAP